MDDEREDEFMDTMPEPTQSHAQLLEMRKRFVTYLARLDEQIRRAAIKEEMDRVVTTDIDHTEIDWLEEHIAQVEGPLPETTCPSENALAHGYANADNTPLIGSTVTSNKPVGGEGVRAQGMNFIGSTRKQVENSYREGTINGIHDSRRVGSAV